MKMYFNPNNLGFSDSPTKGFITEITYHEYLKLLSAQSSGFEIKSKDGLPVLVARNSPVSFELDERLWRNKELSRVDIELYKVQDSDPKAFGTVSQWREYRKALRAWPEHKEFPNKEFRPVAPDA